MHSSETDTVLVVEDEITMSDLVTELLEEAGYAVHTASDYLQAVTAIAAHRPGLMVLDLHLPGVPGSDLIPLLRSQGYGDLPIVIMTADRDAARQLSAESGIGLVIHKPFTREELLACVGRALSADRV